MSGRGVRPCPDLISLQAAFLPDRSSYPDPRSIVTVSASLSVVTGSASLSEGHAIKKGTFDPRFPASTGWRPQIADPGEPVSCIGPRPPLGGQRGAPVTSGLPEGYFCVSPGTFV